MQCGWVILSPFGSDYMKNIRPMEGISPRLRWTVLGRVAGVLLFTMLFSCSHCDTCGGAGDGEDALRFYAILEDDLSGSFAGWRRGDAVGVFTFSSGEVHDRNACYTTQDGEGYFDSSSPIALTVSPRKDVAVYYPFRSDLYSPSLQIDYSHQTGEGAPDYFYGMKQRLVPFGARVPTLMLHRVNALVRLVVRGSDGFNHMRDLKVRLEGLPLSAVLDLRTGDLSVDPATGTAVIGVSGGSHQAVATAVVPPETDLGSVEVVLTYGAQEIRWQPTAYRIGRGEVATYHLTLSGTGSGLHLTVDREPGESAGVPIDPSAGVDGFTEVEVVTGGDDPDAPASAVRADYREEPLVTDASLEGRLLFVRHTAPDSYFADGGSGTRRNYSILFDTKHHSPRCVSYPIYPAVMGDAKRTNAWDYDPDLPISVQPDLHKSYRGKWSRGHMLASSSRTASRELNKTTFYYSNMVPQNQSQNSGVWNQLEGAEQTWGRQFTTYDTLYVACGPVYESLTPTTTTDHQGMEIAIPDATYKVFLRQERKSGNWYSIGFIVPNKNLGKVRYDDFAVPVTEVERQTGLRFFTHLDEEKAVSIKSQNEIGEGNNRHWIH